MICFVSMKPVFHWYCLDIVMPGMDGFGVLNYMNRHHYLEDIPVIMISSEDSTETVRRAYEMGVSDYINRPFDAGVVHRRVYNTIKLICETKATDHADHQSGLRERKE